RRRDAAFAPVRAGRPRYRLEQVELRAHLAMRRDRGKYRNRAAVLGRRLHRAPEVLPLALRHVLVDEPAAVTDERIARPQSLAAFDGPVRGAEVHRADDDPIGVELLFRSQ